MGAAGAQLGTRFVCATECIAHPKLQAGLHPRRGAGRPADRADRPALPGHPGARACRTRAPSASWSTRRWCWRRFQSGEVTKDAAQLEIEHFWAGALRRAVIDGDVEQGSLMAGQSRRHGGRAEQPAAEIIAELIGQAEAALARRPALAAGVRRAEPGGGPVQAQVRSMTNRAMVNSVCRHAAGATSRRVPDDMKRLSQLDAASRRSRPGSVRNCATRGSRSACRSRISRSRSASAGSTWRRWRKAGSATCRRRPMPSASSAAMPAASASTSNDMVRRFREASGPTVAAQDRPDLPRGGARTRRAGRGGDAGGRGAGDRRLYRLVPVVRQREPHGGCRAAAAAPADRAGIARGQPARARRLQPPRCRLARRRLARRTLAP